MAKYMLILRPTDEAMANFENVEFEEILATVGGFNDELIRAGVLLAAEGLDPEGSVVVDFTGEEVVVSDGPYGETKELFSGFWILEVSSKEEAAEWAKRCPLGPGSYLEVRRVHGEEDFPADNEWIQKEEGWREEQAKRAQGSGSEA